MTHIEKQETLLDPSAGRACNAQKPAGSRRSRASQFLRLTKSPFVLLIVLLILVDGAVVYFQSKDNANQFQQNPRLVAIREAIEGGRKPDVIVLGDSLIYSALFFADESAGYVTDARQHFTYLEAKLFSKLLKDQFNSNMDVLNLSMPGANPTDAYLILSELQAHGKLPKLVLYGLSPRAMVDNLVPNAGAIGGKFVLNVKPSQENSAQIDGFLRQLASWDPVANRIREYGQLGDAPGVEKVRNFYVGSIWQYFHERAKVQTQLNELTLTAFNRKAQSTIASAPPAVLDPVAKAKKKKQRKGPKDKSRFQVDKATFQRDLANYQVRYNPPNFDKLDRQTAQLDKCAELLKDNDVRFLIVNMPITKANRSLIDQKLYSQYKGELDKLATTRGATVVDMSQSKEFTRESFLDSVHLNGDGAKRFEHSLISSMDGSWL